MDISLKKKLIIASIVAAASVMLAASPASAFNTPTGPFGDLNVFNATGGTSLTDGLKIHVAQGQIQVTRARKGQLYPNNAKPGIETSDVNNYFTVAFTDGDTVHTISPSDGPAIAFMPDLVWNSAASSAALIEDGKSGTIVNTLTSEETGHGIVTLEITYAYTYPDSFLNLTTKLTLPDGWDMPTRVYWNTDSTLGGADSGNQLEGTLDSNQLVRGVISPDGAQIEAFRQVVGQEVNSWAGRYQCPWEDHTTECNPSSTSAWVTSNTDAPNVISATEDIDNGFGVSVAMTDVAGTSTASFDLLFVSCLSGITAIQCIEDGLVPIVAPVVEVPTLANTGINATQGGLLAGGAALFALVGAGLVIARRRKVNN